LSVAAIWLAQTAQSRQEFLGYRPRLDGLRAVAIGAVLVEHFGSYLANFFLTGYYGVDLFFVISGFLITSILIKDQTRSFSSSYRNFIGRRILRIFPIYYLTILLLLVANYPSARGMWPWLTSYTYNYGVVTNGGPGTEAPLFYLWSLSVEEQFYLFWPLLAIALKKRKDMLFALTAVLVIFSYAQLTFNLVPSLSQFNYTGLPNRMGSLGLGALGAIYLSWTSIPYKFFSSIWVEVGMLILLIFSVTLSFQARFVTMGLCSLYLVLKASLFGFRIGAIDRFLLNPVVVFIGSISYGIYLFHVPVGSWMTQYVFDPIWLALPWDSMGRMGGLRWHSWALKLPLYGALTIGLAALSYRYLESPILSFKDRWFKYDSLAS